MKPYNPIKVEEKIMSEPLSKTEREFLDSIDLKAYGLDHIPKKDLDIMYREYQRYLNTPIEELNGHTLEDVFGNSSKKVKEMTRRKK